MKAASKSKATPGAKPADGEIDLFDLIDNRHAQVLGLLHVFRNGTSQDPLSDEVVSSAAWALCVLIEQAQDAAEELHNLRKARHDTQVSAGGAA